MLSSWEGLTADTTLFLNAFLNDFTVPEGKYYLVDAGFGSYATRLVPAGRPLATKSLLEWNWPQCPRAKLYQRSEGDFEEGSTCIKKLRTPTPLLNCRWNDSNRQPSTSTQGDRQSKFCGCRPPTTESVSVSIPVSGT
jgi:hypothetical protein